jgi:hypothetical protein
MIVSLMGILAAAVIGFGLISQRAEAQAGKPTTQVESPIGRLVAVQLVAWPLSTGVAGSVNGTLVSMPTGWLVIKDGSFEYWVPIEKVMSMKVSR